MGCAMVDERVVIDSLHLVGDNAAVRRHLTAFALKPNVEAVAGVAVEERQASMMQGTVPSLFDEDTAVASAEQMRLLNLIEAEVGAILHHDLDDLVR